MKLVEGEFISDEKNDNYTASYGQRQSEDIDEGKDLIFKNVAKRNLNIIAKHISELSLIKLKKHFEQSNRRLLRIVKGYSAKPLFVRCWIN